MTPLLLMALSAFAANDSLVLVPVADSAPAVAEATAVPIRIWINNSGQFRQGDQARVQVQTQDDGYLIVFNYDTDGRLRVLFPLGPRDDAFVRGGRRYEIRGRGDRESFVLGRDGSGVVYAAVSADPFRTEEVEVGGNWDYARLDLGRDSRDPEAEITDLLQKMSTNRGFDYDTIGYRVYAYRDRYIAGGWWPRPYGYLDDYCDPYWRPSLFGCRYYPAGGWYSGYSPYGYGSYGGYYGYGGWYNPWYRTRYITYPSGGYRYPVVTGRPRGYTIVRRNPDQNNRGGGVIGRSGGFGGGSLGGGRGVIDYRPRGFEGRRPSGVTGRPSDGPSNQPSFERPRGRRVSTPEDRGPIVERDRGQARGPVDFGGDRGRGVGRPTVERDRPQADRERPQAERPRAEPSRRDPPPRNDSPRSSPPARSSGGGGGGGGSHRPHRP